MYNKLTKGNYKILKKSYPQIAKNKVSILKEYQFHVVEISRNSKFESLFQLGLNLKPTFFSSQSSVTRNCHISCQVLNLAIKVGKSCSNEPKIKFLFIKASSYLRQVFTQSFTNIKLAIQGMIKKQKCHLNHLILNSRQIHLNSVNQ